MSLEQFADEVLARRTALRLSQRELATLAGISARTIERLEADRADAPFTKRQQAIAIAIALNWEPDEALTCLGYQPLSARERAHLGSTVVDEELDRLKELLTYRQKQALVDLIKAIVIPHARPTRGPGLGPGLGPNNRGFELPPEGFDLNGPDRED